jgi:fatty acid desaturase
MQMDHRQVLATLSPEERASLTARADAPGLCHLACHLGAIGVSTALILVGVPGWPLVMVVQGVLLVFLFTLLRLCCTKDFLSGLPLSPDGFIPRPL